MVSKKILSGKLDSLCRREKAITSPQTSNVAHFISITANLLQCFSTYYYISSSNFSGSLILFVDVNLLSCHVLCPAIFSLSWFGLTPGRYFNLNMTSMLHKGYIQYIS